MACHPRQYLPSEANNSSNLLLSAPVSIAGTPPHGSECLRPDALAATGLSKGMIESHQTEGLVGVLGGRSLQREELLKGLSTGHRKTLEAKIYTK